MMSEKKIKEGDRVRFIGDYTHYVEETLKKGEVYTISSVDDWGVELSVPMVSHVDTEYLELAPPSDPRTAFLQDLKSVLEKHNAKIVAGHGSGLCLIIGNKAIIARPDHETEVIKITPDNIMDYDTTNER